MQVGILEHLEKPLRPTSSEFLAFCRLIEGETLLTQARGKLFRVEVVTDLLYFIPSSSGKRRRADPDKIFQVVTRLSEIDSQLPRDYQDITFNASYILEVIRQWQDRH
jgi:hypothetical protein